MGCHGRARDHYGQVKDFHSRAGATGYHSRAEDHRGSSGHGETETKIIGISRLASVAVADKCHKCGHNGADRQSSGLASVDVAELAGSTESLGMVSVTESARLALRGNRANRGHWEFRDRLSVCNQAKRQLRGCCSGHGHLRGAPNTQDGGCHYRKYS